MKLTKLNIFFLLICIISILTSCSKQEQFNEQTKNIQLSISGSSTDTLEYLIGGKVIATSNPISGFNIKTLVSTDENQQELQIRKKGSAEILQTKSIKSAPFEQSITCYYDGTKLYDKIINLKTKGYSGTATLEFILNGRVIASGTGKQFPENLSVNINDGETQEIQIRKQGETNILATKVITSTPAEQLLTFYYDGQTILDKLDLTPPVNPLNMSISAKFETSLGGIYTGPVDIVFFIRDLNQPDNVNGNVLTSFHLSLPGDGSFSNSIELPALPANTEGTNYVYSFRIFKSGTTDVVPYTTTGDLAPLKFTNTLAPDFKAGSSQIWILNDVKTVKTSGPPAQRGTAYTVTVTDIAQFFQ